MYALIQSSKQCYGLGDGTCLVVGGRRNNARVSDAEGTLIFLPVPFSSSPFFTMYLTPWLMSRNMTDSACLAKEITYFLYWQ